MSAKMSGQQKAKKTRATSEHPPYKEMITQAIGSDGSPKGISRQKCLRYICTKYKVGLNVRVHLRTSIVRLMKSGYLVQTKGKGAAGSFKLSNATRENEKTKRKAVKQKQKAVTKSKTAAPAAKTKKTVKARKPAAKKTTTAKKTPTKKTTAKKTTVKKTTTKAKKPAAKKAAKKVPAKSPKKKTPARKTGAKKTTKKTGKK